MKFVVKFPPKIVKAKPKPKKFLPAECYPSEKINIGTIIPHDKLPLNVYISTFFTKRSIKEYITLLSAHSVQYKNLKKNLFKNLNTNEVYLSILQKQHYFKLIIKTIVSLRRFVQHWIYKKYKSKEINTEDPATLCVPVKPIYIFDAKAKGIYKFEMQTIKQQLTNDLSYSDWLIPKFVKPKNPFTNLPFTEAQLIYIINYLKSNGMTNWYIEAFREHKYNLKNFHEEMFTPLRLRALNDLVKNTSSDQFVELLYEFVLDQYDYHEYSCKSNLNIIRWAIAKKASDPYIKKWIDIYYKFMRAEILYGKEFVNDHDEIGDVYYAETKKLFDNFREISRLGYLRLESIPTAFRRVSIISISV